MHLQSNDCLETTANTWQLSVMIFIALRPFASKSYPQTFGQKIYFAYSTLECSTLSN